MKLCDFEVGLDRPLFLIAGPCVIESEQLALDTAGQLKDITGRLYQDYKALRLQLIAAVQVAHAQVTPLQSIALAQKILDEMFVFENLLDLDDRGIQLLLREIQSDSLILAMKGASELLREKIFKNMSQRAAEMLREDLESRGPVRLSEVEGEQKEILKIVRRLADEGQIVLGGAGGEEMI